MRASEMVVAIAIVLMPAGVSAAEGQAREAGTPARVPDPVAGVNAMIAPTVPTLLSAGLTAKRDGQEFRASFMPILALDVPYIDVLSESRFTLYTDTSTKMTRASVSVAYNHSH